MNRVELVESQRVVLTTYLLAAVLAQCSRDLPESSFVLLNLGQPLYLFL